MSDIYSILSSNYLTVGSTFSTSSSKYVNVDPSDYQGSWTGKYANGKSFTVAISNVNGFRAKVRYQSGSAVQYQNVLIKDSSFRFGNSKFTLQPGGNAQLKTVMTDGTGASTLETAYANRG